MRNYWNRFTTWFKENQKFMIITLSSIGAFLVFATVLAVALPRKTSESNLQDPQTPANQVKTEQEQRQEDMSESDGHKKMFSPWADMTDWVLASTGYSNNGAININKIGQEKNIKVFHIGFINPDQKRPLESNGDIRWRWGGWPDIHAPGSSALQFNGIGKSLSDLRANGGDYVISFGGQAGISPWTATQNIEKLKNMYLDVIKTYDCVRIDMDIEMSNQNKSHAIANAKALKLVQDETGVEISLTIPIMPYGWDQKQIDLITAYLDNGVKLVCVNSMTMCYGTGLLPGEDYGWASVRAMANAKNQYKTILAERGQNLTDEQVYAQLGATVALGYEGPSYPTFTPALMETVAKDAQDKGYGMLSFWVIARDVGTEKNQGITGKYQHTDIIQKIYK